MKLSNKFTKFRWYVGSGQPAELGMFTSTHFLLLNISSLPFPISHPPSRLHKQAHRYLYFPSIKPPSRPLSLDDLAPSAHVTHYLHATVLLQCIPCFLPPSAGAPHQSYSILFNYSCIVLMCLSTVQEWQDIACLCHVV